MLDVKLDAEQIKRFTLLNVNNRLGHDVRDKVMPVSIPFPHTHLSAPASLPNPRPSRRTGFASCGPGGGDGAGSRGGMRGAGSVRDGARTKGRCEEH